MAGRFPYSKLAKYPHMKPEDVAVWERYIVANPRAFETCDYDVAVGEGAATNPLHPEAIQDMHTILTQKKIDVVAWREGMPWVIEVKPTANARALGQILTYRRLFQKDYPEYRVVIPMVVCGDVEREMEDDFIAHGIVLGLA